MVICLFHCTSNYVRAMQREKTFLAVLIVCLGRVVTLPPLCNSLTLPSSILTSLGVVRAPHIYCGLAVVYSSAQHRALPDCTFIPIADALSKLTRYRHHPPSMHRHPRLEPIVILVTPMLP
jgi:hypothetical protein